MAPSRPCSSVNGPGGASASSRPWPDCDGLGLPVRDRLPEVPGGIDALGRPHVARALVSAGHAESVDDAFRRYLEPGRAAYVRRSGIGPRAAIEAIVAAGGIASLAHSPWAPQEAGVIDRLRDWGLRAIEAFYPGWDEPTVAAVVAFADGSRAAHHGWLRLSRRPRRLRHRAGRHRGAARGRRAAPRGPGRRMSIRAPLPVLDQAPPATEVPRSGARPDSALEEYATEGRLLPGLPCLDAGVPDERLRLGGDGGRPAGRRLQRGAGSRGCRPHRHQHLLDPRDGRAEGHRTHGPAASSSRPPTRRCGWSSRAARSGPTTRASCSGATRRWISSCVLTRSPS